MSTWFSILSRRKPLPSADHAPQESGQLARVLSTLDLTALGVGSTLGVGVYVLAGHVAKETAGPAVVLSFLIAAVASVFAGLCYAEFGARVPKAGSAYVYSYVCVGELIAFIIGWNLILEYVIGSASVAKGLSVYLDTLVNNTMRNAFIDIAPIHSSFMSDYFDFFSFAITLVLGAALAFGMKESSLANNIFTLINILVVVFVIIAGGIKANTANWSLTVNETIREEYNAGNGGFLPFGIEGVIKGAATCFYGFVGFDTIATTGEEVKNPQRAIPISIILSLFIIFLSYFGTSAVVTMMLPYYLQDPDAPIPHAFDVIGWNWAKWIVSIGGIFGLCASLFGAMFPLPRIIYAMANDALVFRFLGTVNTRFRTPVVGTLLAALLTGLMSALFNLKQLVNMMSIGTLMAYTIVAACVIILRYSVSEEEIADWRYSLLQPGLESEDEYSDVGHTYDQTEEYTENLNLIPPSQDVTMGTIIKTMFNFSNRTPTYLTQRLVTILVFVFCLFSLILAGLLSYLKEDLENGELFVIIPLGITVLCMVVTLIGMYAQPTVNATLSFKVPLVPLIPALSICINIYLMLMLDGNTWIRFGIWMAIGVPIYLICCKLYYLEKQPEKPLKNGHVNNGFIPENGGIKTNDTALTIPNIVVDPPSTDQFKMEDESETEHVRTRSVSIDSNEFNNAVLEIDKVLKETENEYEFVDNFEAINPENEYKNESILIDIQSIGSIRSNLNDQMDNQSICSSSDSEHSKEYHIEVQIHQTDSDETSDVPEEVNDLSEGYIPAPPPIQGLLDLPDVSVVKVDENKTIESNIPPSPPIQGLLDEMAKQRDVNVDENKTNDSNIPRPPPIQGLLDEVAKQSDLPDVSVVNVDENKTTEGNIPPPPPIQGLLDEMAKQRDVNVDENKTNESNIPPPPPIEGLLDEMTEPTLISPTVIKRPALFSDLELQGVKLKPVVVKQPRKRTDSTNSEGPNDNVKAGTVQHNKIKSKLDKIFKNRPLLLPPQSLYLVEDKIPSPTSDKKIETVDQVAEDISDDIPEDYRKTKEFKDSLSDLILRRQSTDSLKSGFVPEKKYVKQNETTPTNDEIKHKKLMQDNLKSISLRKSGLVSDKEGISIEDDSKKLKPQINNTEKDKEKHKRLMIATLRNIKLRRTGLAINEMESKEDISNDDIDR